MKEFAQRPRRHMADFWLIGGVLVVAAGVFAALFLWAQDGQYVEVTVDGAVVATVPLDADSTQVIAGINGQNTLVIADGKALVTAATCPDKVCVRHRAIARTGESILCLPHKVAVRVVGGESAVDAEV